MAGSFAAKIDWIEVVGANLEIFLVDIESFDELCQWSDTIVKAKYVSREAFTSDTDIFSFELEEDYLSNVEEGVLHIYESPDTSFYRK